MERWSAKEGIGCLAIIIFMIWVLVQCTGGGGEKSDGLNTQTVTETYLAADYDTFKRGQEVIATGDAGLFDRYMNSVLKIDKGIDVYIHDVSPLKGYAKVAIRSGEYRGEVGYVPSIALDKTSRPSDNGKEQSKEETKNKEVKPPLIQAIIDKDVVQVKELSKNKVLINEKYKGYTPLHNAILFSDGDMEIIRVLVENGADLKIKNDKGISPFFMAVDYSFVKAIYLFLDKGGANVNELDNEGNTPLMMLALRSGIPTDVFMEITERMIKAGADLNLKNKNGDTFYSNIKKVQNDATVKEIERKYPSSSK